MRSKGMMKNNIYCIAFLFAMFVFVVACGSSGEDLLGIDKSDPVEPTAAGTDSSGTGVVVPLGNQTPTLTVVTPSGTVAGNISISYTIFDANSDSCFIRPEFSVDGGTIWYYASAGSGGDGIETLDSSPEGVVHTYVWDSFSDNVGLFAVQPNVMFRIKVSDYYVEGEFVNSEAFLVNNSGNTRTLVNVLTPVGIQSGDITISYVLVDAQHDPIDIIVEVSLDGGVTWQGAVEQSDAGSEGTSGLSSSGAGESHSFIWDSIANSAGQQFPADNDVRIRITPNDGSEPGFSGETSSFTVENFISGTFVPAGRMSSGRYWHTSTTMADGNIMLVGGFDGTTALDTAEVFDTASGTFTQMTGLNTARYGHSAVLLDNGNILVVGGISAAGAYINNGEEYEPGTDTWTVTVNNMTVQRAFTQMVKQVDDRVLVWSGRVAAGTTRLFYHLYDPAAHTFSAELGTTYGREGFSLVTLDDGSIFIVGGSDQSNGTGNLIDTCQLYVPDAGNGILSDTGSTLAGRYWPGVVRLQSNKVFICGGSAGTDVWTSCDLYDPDTGLVAFAGDMSEARRRHVSALLSDGRVLIAGGESLGPIRISQSAEIYDPSDGSFVGTGSMIYKRYYHTCNTLPDGKLIIIGGYDNTQITRDCEVYIP